jgi:adenosylcobinamide-phosphate synthase
VPFPLLLAGAPAPALVTLAGALLWDALAGEPPGWAHPVVWIGRAIGACERRARRGSPLVQLARGALLALAVPLASAGAAALLLEGLAGWPWLQLLTGVWLLKSCFAIRALGEAAAGVARPLAAGDLPAARAGLRSLCSRDPSALDAQAVAAGAVESVAENSSDSIVAPLLFFALFGVPGALAYRAINTMDAMIGYHGRYEYLGKAAARLDDLANLIPARLTAALLLLAGALGGHSARRGWRVLRRDGGNTESPNAGRPMAAMAGLLGVRLEKQDHYRLGDPGAALDAGTIGAAWRVARAAALLMVGLTALLATVTRSG